MNPTVLLWREIIEPYRASEWHECIRMARHLVDDDPYDLSTRALLASLYLKSGDHERARLQYERLLSLAVGHRDLIRALCAQKRLDALHLPGTQPPDRYSAMQVWFRYLISGPTPADEGPGFSVTKLVQCDPADFNEAMEHAAVWEVPMTPQVADEAEGQIWIRYYGRVRWRQVVDGHVDDAPRPSHVIVLPKGDPSRRHVELVAETPAECLVIPGRFAEVLGLGSLVSAPLDPGLPGPDQPGITAAAPASPSPGAPTPDFAPDVHLDPQTQAEREATEEVAHAAPPAPDPFTEPTPAVGAPHERRRETRFGLSLESGTAYLGESGKPVPPLCGTIADISRGGIGIVFAGSELRQSQDVFPDAVLPARIVFHEREEPIDLQVRVAWIRQEHTPEEGALVGRMGLEFVSVSAEDRSRLLFLLDEAARSEADLA